MHVFTLVSYKNHDDEVESINLLVPDKHLILVITRGKYGQMHGIACQYNEEDPNITPSCTK